LQSDLTDLELEDEFWADAPKTLPCGKIMLNRDVKSALDGGEIKYFKSIGTPRITTCGVPIEERNYYFSLFHFCEEFGLPKGRGWTNELPWVPHFLLQMRNVKRAIISDMERKTSQGAKDINPKHFEG
jgi:hypothetical protein